MVRKTSKSRGSSVIAALIVLCALIGYGLSEWKLLPDTMEAVPASRQAAEEGMAPEKITLPEKGEPVRMLTMNTGNYFVPEDPRRSNFQVKYKPRPANAIEKKGRAAAAQGTGHAGR